MVTIVATFNLLITCNVLSIVMTRMQSVDYS